MPVGTKDVGQTEAVQRKQDVGRHALPEAFHRLGAGLGDDDVKSSRLSKADRRGQTGRSPTDDQNVTPGGDQAPFGSSLRRQRARRR